MKEITTWAAWSKKDKRFVHNHIEDGWAVGAKPIPRFVSQGGWSDKEWEKEFCFLVDNRVVRRGILKMEYDS